MENGLVLLITTIVVAMAAVLLLQLVIARSKRVKVEMAWWFLAWHLLHSGGKSSVGRAMD